MQEVNEDVEAIVIVDDDEIDRRAIIRCLPRRLLEHYAIVELENGEQLLEFCRSSTPTSILLDNQLPGVDGVGVLNQLSKITLISEIGIVLLTGTTDNKLITSAFRAGVYDFLHKSELTPERLREVMRRAIEKSVAARELRLSRQNLQSALAETREAVASQGRFVAALSHELRNPITGLVGLSALIGDSNLDARDAEYFMLLKDSAKEVLSLIDALLERETLKHGKSESREEVFSLEECIQAVCNVLALQLMQNEVTINSNIGKTVPRKLRGSLASLKQILLNLLGNAIKFSPGSAEIELMVDLQEDLAEDEDHIHLQFAIVDRGIGISKEQQKTIFQPFSEISKQTRRTFGGTGLGLSIARELVELLGGKIWLESEPGEGTTFYFTLECSKP